MTMKLYGLVGLALALSACGGAESVGPAAGTWGVAALCLEAEGAPDVTRVAVHVEAEPGAAPHDFGARIADRDITVHDDGVAPDEVAGDLIYTGRLDARIQDRGCEVVTGEGPVESVGQAIGQRRQAVGTTVCSYYYSRFLENGCLNPSGCVYRSCMTIGPFEFG